MLGFIIKGLAVIGGLVLAAPLAYKAYGQVTTRYTIQKLSFTGEWQNVMHEDGKILAEYIMNQLKKQDPQGVYQIVPFLRTSVVFSKS